MNMTPRHFRRQIAERDATIADLNAELDRRFADCKRLAQALTAAREALMRRAAA